MICFALKLAPWSLNKRKMRLHHWMKNNNITMCLKQAKTNPFLTVFSLFVRKMRSQDFDTTSKYTFHNSSALQTVLHFVVRNKIERFHFPKHTTTHLNFNIFNNIYYKKHVKMPRRVGEWRRQQKIGRKRYVLMNLYSEPLCILT